MREGGGWLIENTPSTILHTITGPWPQHYLQISHQIPPANTFLDQHNLNFSAHSLNLYSFPDLNPYQIQFSFPCLLFSLPYSYLSCFWSGSTHKTFLFCATDFNLAMHPPAIRATGSSYLWLSTQWGRCAWLDLLSLMVWAGRMSFTMLHSYQMTGIEQQGQPKTFCNLNQRARWCLPPFHVQKLTGLATKS